MGRWLFNVLSAVSLGLFVGVVILWVRSHFVRDWIEFTWNQQPWALGSGDGKVTVGQVVDMPMFGKMFTPAAWLRWYVSLAAMCAALPYIRLLLWAVEREIRERGTARYCHVCDYNLTGNISGICPECGTAIPADPTRSQTAGEQAEGDEKRAGRQDDVCS